MSNNTRKKIRITKRKKRSKKRLLFMLAIAIIGVFIVVNYGLNLLQRADDVVTEAYESDGRDKSELRDKIVDPKFDNVSILIMGVDSSDKRENAASARTDTLMLATLNKDDKSVKLISIPRDSYVYIPEVGYEDKINHAHAFGGTKAAIETVENLFNIPVDYYLKVNFEAFIDVVDALDGITVEVPYDFSEQDSKDRANAIQLYAGLQDLDGEEALALARTRKLDNDIERGKRQQEIIKAIVDKAISLSSIFKYDDMIEAMRGNLATNMSPSEMKSFVSYGTSGTNLDFETMTLEGENYQPNKIYYWKLDEIALNETKSKLQQHLEITPSVQTYTESNADSQYENASPSIE